MTGNTRGRGVLFRCLIILVLSAAVTISCLVMMQGSRETDDAIHVSVGNDSDNSNSTTVYSPLQSSEDFYAFSSSQ